MKLLICFGTRPEWLKIQSLLEHRDSLPQLLIQTLFTGQHQHLVTRYSPTYSLGPIRASGRPRLNAIVSHILSSSLVVQAISQNDLVMVQGDTSSAFGIALASYHQGKPVIHLEAGLRTYEPIPFPEEANRQMIARLASWHLCPTQANRNNLINENIESDSIYVTGNTIIDILPPPSSPSGNKVLVTLHRRENLAQIAAWFQALAQLAQDHTELEFVWPMHPNPEIQQHRDLGSHVNIVEPLQHLELLDLLQQSVLVITDSGGIQEEASYYHRKLVVCRSSTERPEVLELGLALLCPEPGQLAQCFNQLMERQVDQQPCPYGTGNAWQNIYQVLECLQTTQQV